VNNTTNLKGKIMSNATKATTLTANLKELIALLKAAGQVEAAKQLWLDVNEYRKYMVQTPVFSVDGYAGGLSLTQISDRRLKVAGNHQSVRSFIQALNVPHDVLA
jgi:hypothetical protein